MFGHDVGDFKVCGFGLWGLEVRRVRKVRKVRKVRVNVLGIMD